ncbi:MFS transporter [Candidatus Poribacteria bacterium]|nr:MFS transporter [Candidatus Poribacteria bacterium]
MNQKISDYLSGISHNVKILLIISIIFGGTFGIYDLILPFYLKERNISFHNMGYIFSIASVGMFLAQIYLGNLSDQWGRKPFYALALLVSCLASGLTPFVASLLLLIILKTLWDVGGVIRSIMHPILLYEDNRSKFMDFLGKTRGIEFLFQAGGTLVALFTLTSLGYSGNLWIAGAGLACACFLFAFSYRERKNVAAKKSFGTKSLLSWRDLSHNLKVIVVAYFIFTIGLRTSHNFIMPLFFKEKFGATDQAVFWVMLIHRITIALPMLFIGNIQVKNLKATYIITVLFEGFTIAVSAFIPNFIAASAVWLLHDFVGAGVWMPIQSAIIQEYSREGARGLDVSKTLAFSSIGGIFGPLLAGYISPFWISGPFFISGVITIMSAVVLFKLSLKENTVTLTVHET